MVFCSALLRGSVVPPLLVNCTARCIIVYSEQSLYQSIW